MDTVHIGGGGARPEGLTFLDGTPYAFVVGERTLATGGRRHLVTERVLSKEQVTFSGYWRIGKHR